MYNTYTMVDSKPQSQTWTTVAAAALGFVAFGAVALSFGLNSSATQLYTTTTTTRVVPNVAVPAQGRVMRAPIRNMAAVEPMTFAHAEPTQRLEGLPAVRESGLNLTWLGATVATTAFAFFLGKRSVTPEPIAMMAASAEPAYDYDSLINQMLGVPENQLPALVQQSMPILKPAFFERVDKLADQTADEAMKAKLKKLGDQVLAEMKALVNEAQGKVQAMGVLIQGLIGIMANEEGKIEVPLDAEKTKRLREVIRGDLQKMSNDVFLNAMLAFMAKAGEDKQMELIAGLQKILQNFAAESLLIMAPFGGSNPGEADAADVQLWVTLLTKEVEDWESILEKEFFSSSKRSSEGFKKMLDEGVGGVIFENSKGAIQQVLAQFVYQIIERMDKLSGAPASA
mmetsp:Transcript_29100/g.52312  ORF Transcript_29100/g.52312 Transcript_29100/m.52312 type:complete len:398 (-) Transcript_29100:721-1914(-)